MFIRPQKFEASLVSKIYLNPKVIEILLKVENPDFIIFNAGQFISLEVANGEFRAYSITSSEQENKHVRLLIEVGHEGKGVTLVKNMHIGDKVHFIGPSGKFVLPPLLPSHIVFIATGVGLAPFESMVDKLKHSNYLGKIDFFFGVRSDENLFKVDFLQSMKNNLKNFTYTLCFSQNTLNPSDNPIYKNIELGRVTKIVPNKLATEELEKSDSLFLICGNPNMVSDMTAILEEQGIPSHQILSEKFN